MLEQPFAQHARTLTVSNVTAWARRVLTSPAGSPGRREVAADLDAVSHSDPPGCACAHPGRCGHALERLAAAYLRESGLLPVAAVDDFPHVTALIDADTAERGDAGWVLTDDELAAVCDRAPGGRAFFERHGADAIRARCVPAERAGASELAGYLDAPLPERLADRADWLLRHRDVAAGQLVRAVHAALPDEEVAERDRFLAEAERAGARPDPQAMVLVLPPLVELRQIVAAWGRQLSLRLGLDAGDTAGDELRSGEALAAVAEVRAGRAAGEVRDLVLSAAADATGLPRVGADAGENVARVADLLDGEVPHGTVFRAYPRLRRAVEGALRPGRPPGDPRGQARMPVGGAPLRTRADVHALLRGHVETDGRLPSKRQLGRDTVRRVEQVSGMVYATLCENLHRELGWRLPDRSLNEERLGDLADAAFPDAERLVEWSWHRDFGTSHRTDLLVRSQPALGAPVEVHMEADGEGHFQPVAGWDLAAARDRDVRKAELIARRRVAGAQVAQVALHHAALPLLDGAQLRALVDEALTQSWWWVFARPRGVEDMRAAPAPPRPVDVAADAGGTRVEVFALDADTAAEVAARDGRAAAAA